MYDLDIGYSSFAFSQAPTYTGDDISEALQEEKEIYRKKTHYDSEDDEKPTNWLEDAIIKFLDNLIEALGDDDD